MGNCEEEPVFNPFFFFLNLSVTCWLAVGRLSVTCRPTVDQQSADRFFGELFFTITVCMSADLDFISAIVSH